MAIVTTTGGMVHNVREEPVEIVGKIGYQKANNFYYVTLFDTNDGKKIYIVIIHIVSYL